MDPYVYPGTNILINKFGIKDDAEKLNIIEGRLFVLKSQEPLPHGSFDYDHLKAIHKHFFADIYDWAGQERIVDIAKENSYFGHIAYISGELTKLFNNLKKENYLQNLDHPEFCKKLSYYFNEINAAHPFREGNGRTQRAFCDMLAKEAGYLLDIKLLNHNRDEYLQASIDGFLRANYTPMEKIFQKVILPLERVRPTIVAATPIVAQTEKFQISSTQLDNEIVEIIEQFKHLDKQIENAEKQDYVLYRTLALEDLNKYANKVNQDQRLMAKLHVTAPKIEERIQEIISRESEIEL